MTTYYYEYLDSDQYGQFNATSDEEALIKMKWMRPLELLYKEGENGMIIVWELSKKEP